LTGEGIALPVGGPVEDDDRLHDTLFFHARILKTSEEAEDPVAEIRVRRAIISKIVSWSTISTVAYGTNSGITIDSNPRPAEIP
jgi:hypothetical protein